MANFSNLWSIHIFCTFFMTGVIWLVQLVVYPVMKWVGRSHFAGYHKAHCDRIAFVVGPMIILEWFSSFLLLFVPRPVGLFLWVALMVVLSSSCLISTGILFVPLHRKLKNGFSTETLNHLVRFNWIRTVLWTTHSLIIIYVQILITKVSN